MSETTFYDQKGSPIAYTQDGTHIYTFSGKPVAYLHGNSVYSYDGNHLGWFENGWIRDNSGNCVFYTNSAKGGPVKPVKSVKPIKSVKSIRPIKSVKSIAPVKSVFTLSWSNLSGEHFFGS